MMNMMNVSGLLWKRMQNRAGPFLLSSIFCSFMNNYEVIHPSTYFPNLYPSRVTGGLELVPDDFEPWGTLGNRSITGLAQRDGKTCTLVFISASNFPSPCIHPVSM